MTCFNQRHRSFCALRLGTAPREAPSTAPAAVRRAELFGAAAAKAAELFGLAFTRNGDEHDETMSLWMYFPMGMRFSIVSGNILQVALLPTN